MGSGIFNHLLSQSFIVVWHHIPGHEAALNKLKKKIDRHCNIGLISQYEMEIILKNIIITDDLAKLKDCNLIIEAITENLHEKNSLFNRLIPLVNEQCLFATNSSSLIPEQFDCFEQVKNRFFGLHFFYPVETNSMVEVILHSSISKSLEKHLLDFVRSIEKKELVQSSTHNAFAANRYFLEIQSELYQWCIDSSISFEKADTVISNRLFAAGIFRMMDVIGLDILHCSIINYTKQFAIISDVNPMLNFISENLAAGNTGMKSGKGFLNYPVDEIMYSEEEASKILGFVEHIFRKFASKYIENKMFDMEQIRTLIKEYTGSEFSPLD